MKSAGSGTATATSAIWTEALNAEPVAILEFPQSSVGESAIPSEVRGASRPPLRSRSPPPPRV